MALKAVFLAALFVAVTAELAPLKTCSDDNADVCTVSELRITPCKSKRYCLFKKGINATMSFDFTPKFAATKMKTAVYWADIVFPDIGITDACQFTNCPVTPGQQQTFDFTLPIGKKLPDGTYDFKWVVWNEENVDEKCCLMTTVKIRK